MNSFTTSELQIERGRVIAILRGDFRGNEGMLADAIYAGGLSALEVTLNSKDAIAVISRLIKQSGSRMGDWCWNRAHP